MVVKSFSKINLSLNVNKKLKNGMHNIQSHYCLINLHDTIKIKKHNLLKDKIIFTGKFSKGIKKNDNTIIKTLRILRKNKILSGYYSIKIFKNIPTFAGLGGGTSNAFYLLKYFKKKNIKTHLLNKLKKVIGSDILLFVNSQGFQQNIAKIKKIKKNKLFFILIYPFIKCSTKQIYSEVKNFSKQLRYNSQQLNGKSKFISFVKNQKNDLQSIVEKKYPVISRVLNDLSENNGCYFSRLTGSGSVCYGVFKSEKQAKKALNKIKFKYPKFWVSSAKTI